MKLAAEKDSQLHVSNFLHLPSKTVQWLERSFCSLSVGNKIRGGYVLAFSITALGTAIGLGVGRFYEEKVKYEAHKWHEAGILLNSLQVSVLQARSHQQQFIPLIGQPQEFREEHAHFLRHINDIKTLLGKIKFSTATKDVEGLPRFLQIYDGTVEAYLAQIEAALSQIELSKLTQEQILQVQQSLLNTSNSQIALKFDRLSDDLTQLAKVAFEQEINADENLERVEQAQLYAANAIILLSAIVGITIAAAISRAIAHPIKAATKVAQQVTKEENFHLQAPITTADEVGVLTNSLNQLIRKVNALLEEQKAAVARQQELQEQQLLQNEKMSSLGRMLAGVAHEINNPVNFIYGNINYANEYIDNLLTLVATYQAEIPNPPIAIQAQVEEIELDFLQEDLPKVLQSMRVGADRVRQIILSLKDFSRLDEAEAHSVDLHACIDSTLLILHNRIKKGIEVVRNYNYDIPSIQGYAGFLYQVFMNLLSNSLDAFEEQAEVENNKQKRIVITTERMNKDWVAVRISDNGAGIARENIGKIFDTFFTTKPRGIGTGLGLAITRQIVEEKHKGRIICTSEIGEGTEFAIALPIQTIEL
jgi:two-component system, NtrC family, sensor kinase